MAKKRKFAEKLTKEDLMNYGIKDIWYDPDEPRYHIIGNDGEEINITKGKLDYLYIQLYDLDDEGNKIKIPVKKKYKYRGCIKETDGYNYKGKPMPLSRAVYAWFNGEATEGLVVDHVDNKHDTQYDNRLDNLQLITQKENRLKNCPKGPRNSRSEIPCNMKKPIQYYIDKLNYWLMEYVNEKEERGSQTNYAGLCRHNYSVFKKKVRYWYNHKSEWEEYDRLETAKVKAFQCQHERRSKIEQLKQEIKQAKEISIDEWRKKLKEYNAFLEKFPYQTQSELEKKFLDEIKLD